MVIDRTSLQEGKMQEKMQNTAQVLSFADRYIVSQAFRDLFRAGMDLVEETASYLDGEGRKEAQELDRGWKVAYARETMQLTNRLMKMASWILLARSRSENEISDEDFLRRKVKFSLEFPDTSEEILDGKLPPKVIDLIRRSQKMMDDLRRIDKKFFSHKAG